MIKLILKSTFKKIVFLLLIFNFNSMFAQVDILIQKNELNNNYIKPIANKPSPIYRCFTGINNTGFEYFDLTESENEVLGKQNASKYFLFEYFTSKEDAYNFNSKKIENSSNYLNLSAFHDRVWIRISMNTNKKTFDVTSLDLLVPISGLPKLDPKYFICEDFETKFITPAVLDTTGPINDYYEWRRDGVLIDGEHGSILTTSIPGYYSVIKFNGCIQTTPVFTTVIKYSPNIIINHSDFFEKETFANVNVINGSGNFEYKLDDNLYQNDNSFYNLKSGEHIIYVRDKDGFCSPNPVKFIILDYPKFMTPNGDGYNDTWNISDFKKTNSNAKISIFDRFGKLIKQITPESVGWDGTMNGIQLPSTDYWFTVNYFENGLFKDFSSHFSLKR